MLVNKADTDRQSRKIVIPSLHQLKYERWLSSIFGVILTLNEVKGKNPFVPALFRVGFFFRLVFFSLVILSLNEVKAKNLGEGMDSGLRQNDIELLFPLPFFFRLVFVRRKDIFEIAL
jgi:hypothetical protein